MLTRALLCSIDGHGYWGEGQSCLVAINRVHVRAALLHAPVGKVANCFGTISVLCKQAGLVYLGGVRKTRHSIVIPQQLVLGFGLYVQFVYQHMYMYMYVVTFNIP